MAEMMDIASKVSRWLVIIGGLNWGIMGLTDFNNGGSGGENLVNMVLGAVPQLEGTVYVLVGLGALMMIYEQFKKKA